MLDKDGFRANVAIVLSDGQGHILWAKRLGQDAWQFPQGGIQEGESPKQAMYRELDEEVGLEPHHVKIIGRTDGWLRYDVPRQFVRRDSRASYKGQKQIWFLLRLIGSDSDVSLRKSEIPEFDAWRWHSFFIPLDSVIEFKRDVYKQALAELAPHLKLRLPINYQ